MLAGRHKKLVVLEENMASARKKQDEKNLKTLRELVALPENRYCFDCNQRGPTYVNVTIGSFVCTKCSGLLRGLTPPQRVKSISMATFTSEEVELMRNRGNYYCRRTWMALYDGIIPTDGISDEQKVRDFMVDKYERRRYYMEPTASLRNGHNQQTNNVDKVPEVKPPSNLVTEAKPLRINGVGRPEGKAPKNSVTKNGKVEFVADFAHADIFNAANNNTNNNNNKSFANFDNNPVFNNTKNDFSIFDLQFTSCGPVLNRVPLFPKCNVGNCWNGGTSQPLPVNQSAMLSRTAAPSEDRYAALKDLDNALKAQPALDWNSSSSSSLYSSPTSGGSVYNSPMSQSSSAYGSPNQGQFPTFFPQETVSNPFNTFWNGNGSAPAQPASNGCVPSANPFRSQDPFKGNSFSTSFQSNFTTTTQAINGTSPWTPNPFKVVGTASNGHSNNPFL